jgi:cell division protein FtsQ
MEKERRRPASRRTKARDEDVVYTQPKPFLRNRFVLRLATVLAVVLALLFGLSLFFKVENVEVAGTNKYQVWDVREASGIRDGENLLTLSKAKICGNIIANLPYVKSVQVAIRLPGTVVIQVEELTVVYAVEDNEGMWWLMDADGRIVDSTTPADAQDHLRILGVQISGAKIGSRATAYELEPELDSEGNPVPVAISGADRLRLAIAVLQALEGNGILGQVPSVDVTDITNVLLSYTTRFQVRLGDGENLTYKVGAMKQAVDQMEGYESGELDASFTLFPDKVVYSPLTQ